MDSDRIYRYTIPGWAFILSFLYFFWLFGGSPTSMFSSTLSPAAAGIVGAVVSFAASPAVGFFCHVIADWALFCWRGHWHSEWKPANHDEATAYADFLSRFFRTDSSKKTIEELRKWELPHKVMGKKLWRLLNHQFWTYAQPEIADYMVRGWTRYWTLANSLAAVLLGSAMAGLSFGYLCWSSSLSVQYAPEKLITLLAPVFMVVFGYMFAKRMRIDVTRFYRLWWQEYTNTGALRQPRHQAH